ncbi:RNA polymerase sigma-70 factor, ECF subfamily [Actinacidiphila alni]|uniref:RNA polymerase sigma-70 factor, ECF subfamily n=1 Tax=Actinacidiphila alni TaxID=380248 RepID=A0A1I2EKF4_9ACTN|nr:RNA polymerase sigma-70 factor, ECF subfamily [Actinacidiphila alni]
MGVVAPEFGPLGLIGIRTVADPGRLVFVNGQWPAADRPAD